MIAEPRPEKTAEDRAAQIKRLIESGRFYYIPKLTDENRELYQAMLVKRHSAEVTILPAKDLAETSRKNVSDYIEDALEIHGDAMENNVLRQIINLSPEMYDGRGYLIYGLYLYLASEVSRIPNHKGPNGENKSFLQAGREVLQRYVADGKADENGNIKTQPDRIEWLKDVFKELGLYDQPHIQKFVTDWSTRGCFFVETPEGVQEKQYFYWGTTSGTWIKLAELVCDPLETVSQNEECIELALAERETYNGLDPKAAYEYTRNLVAEAEKLVAAKVPRYSGKIGNNKLLNKLKAGRKKRRDSLETEIEKLRQKYKDRLISDKEQSDAFFNELLPELSDETLDIMEATKTRFVFHEGDNIKDAYPKDNPCGVTHNHCETTRGSLGVWEEYHNLIYFCVGGRKKDIKVLAHTIEHETMHRALNDVSVRISNQLMGTKDTTGAIIKRGEVGEYLQACLTTYPHLCAKAVRELAAGMTPEMRAHLRSDHDHSAVDMFCSMSLPARIKLYNRLPPNDTSKLDIKTMLYVCLPKKERANLYGHLDDDKAQKKLFQALSAEYKYDLYRALEPRMRKELMQAHWLKQDDARIINGFNDMYKFDPADEKSGLPYTPAAQYDMDTWPATMKVINAKFPKTICLQDIFSTISSGDAMAMYLALHRPLTVDLGLSEPAQAEFSRREEARLKKEDYTPNKDPEIERELEDKLSLALVRQFCKHMPQDVAVYIENNYRNTSLMVWREQRSEALQGMRHSSMMNPLCYPGYSKYDKPHEIAANSKASERTESLLERMPQTPAMNPVRDLSVRRRSTMNTVIEHLFGVSRDKDQRRAELMAMEA